MIRLAEQLVPVADEVWRLQRKSDPECRFFQEMVAGRPGLLQGSQQGIYVCTASGRLLARRNTLDPERALELMQSGLEKWRTLPPAERRLDPNREFIPVHRWEKSYPEKGLVLIGFNRDLPESTFSTAGGAELGERMRAGNRDHVWFDRSEARAWLPPKPEPGASHSLPEPIAQRLARFHLVDNVRGQTGPFAPEEVSEAHVTTEVQSCDGDRIRLGIRGRTRCESDGVWKLGENDWKHFPSRPRGIATELAGWAEFDREAGRFRSFELVAVGKGWGTSSLNCRPDGDETDFPLGFYFTLAPPGDRVAPAFVDVYDADWIVPPSIPEEPAPAGG